MAESSDAHPVITEYSPGRDAPDVVPFLVRWVTGDHDHARDHLADHETGEGTSLIARSAGRVVGIVTLRWNSRYPDFAARQTPLVHQMAVEPTNRRRGVGSALMDAAEKLAARRGHTRLGITVGIFDAYGPAQRLYARRGYVPDGHGVCRGHTPLKFGDHVVVDHRLMLWLTKELALNGSNQLAQG